MDYLDMSYNQLKINFERGILDPYDLMEVYKRERENAMKQVRAIEKSDVPFTSSEKPEFARPSEIGDTGELLKAFSDLSAYKRSGNYTIKERREKRDKTINTMRSHGMDFVDKSNFHIWGQFMEWFRANNLNKLYGSQDDVIENFFEDNWQELSDTPKSEWIELFEEFIEGL